MRDPQGAGSGACKMGGEGGVVVLSPVLKSGLPQRMAVEESPEFLGAGRLECLEEGEEKTGVESMAEVWRCGVRKDQGFFLGGGHPGG